MTREPLKVQIVNEKTNAEKISGYISLAQTGLNLFMFAMTAWELMVMLKPGLKTDAELALEAVKQRIPKTRKQKMEEAEEIFEKESIKFIGDIEQFVRDYEIEQGYVTDVITPAITPTKSHGLYEQNI